jgi:hypothetical protein
MIGSLKMAMQDDVPHQPRPGELFVPTTALAKLKIHQAFGA